jgi:hypothetical protein
MPVFHSRCHCGNLQADLETQLRADEFTVRSCQCSFCRRHRTRNIVDKEGLARIRVADAELLSRYQWNTRSAEFLVCKRCGGYLGAAMATGDRWVMTLNVNLFDEVDQFTQQPTKVSYEAEAPQERRLRREASWTPAVWERT